MCSVIFGSCTWEWLGGGKLPLQLPADERCVNNAEQLPARAKKITTTVNCASLIV